MITREKIVEEALTWVGTPYRHHQRVKGAGVDCGQILIAIYSSLGFIPEFDPGYYPADWMNHRDEERYLGFVEQYAKEVKIPLPGDLAVWRFGRLFSHGAIVIDWPNIIHAYAQDRQVCKANALGGALGDPSRPVKFYSLIGDK